MADPPTTQGQQSLHFQLDANQVPESPVWSPSRKTSIGLPPVRNLRNSCQSTNASKRHEIEENSHTSEKDSIMQQRTSRNNPLPDPHETEGHRQDQANDALSMERNQQSRRCPVPNIISKRSASVVSVFSTLSHPQEDHILPDKDFLKKKRKRRQMPKLTTLEEGNDGPKQPHQNTSHENETKIRRKASMITWKEGNNSPNQPHPALEYPPLYFLVRRFPQLVEPTKAFFRARWGFSYYLQHRIPLSRTVLRKMNIFVTLGELLLIIPFIIALDGLHSVYSFAHPSVSISGQTARTPLIFAFVTAMRNSPLTLLFGIPVDRAIWYHKLSAQDLHTSTA